MPEAGRQCWDDSVLLWVVVSRAGTRGFWRFWADRMAEALGSKVQ